jgi:hypothetical protein
VSSGEKASTYGSKVRDHRGTRRSGSPGRAFSIQRAVEQNACRQKARQWIQTSDDRNGLRPASLEKGYVDIYVSGTGSGNSSRRILPERQGKPLCRKEPCPVDNPGIYGDMRLIQGAQTIQEEKRGSENAPVYPHSAASPRSGVRRSLHTLHVLHAKRQEASTTYSEHTRRANILQTKRGYSRAGSTGRKAREELLPGSPDAHSPASLPVLYQPHSAL